MQDDLGKLTNLPATIQAGMDLDDSDLTVVDYKRRCQSSHEKKTSNGIQPAWGKIWKLGVTPKIRNLLWRCAKDILPVRTNLRKRRMNVTAECPLCSSAEETIIHIFLECPAVSPVWIAAGINTGPTATCFAGWLESWLTNSNDRITQKMADILWFIWCARNDAEAYAKKANGCLAPRTESNLTGSSLRCFVDAALFEDAGLAGFGVIVKNSDDHFVAARSGTMVCSLDPYHAELWAIKEALSWIKQEGWSRVTILSDCLNACNGLNNPFSDRSYAGAIIDECMSLRASVDRVSVQHIARSSNGLAHDLAKSTFPYRNSSEVTRMTRKPIEYIGEDLVVSWSNAHQMLLRCDGLNTISDLKILPSYRAVQPLSITVLKQYCQLEECGHPGGQGDLRSLLCLL
nr:uncharacterized protein LOC109153341 [Ipomoea batatas]